MCVFKGYLSEEDFKLSNIKNHLLTVYKKIYSATVFGWHDAGK